MPEWMQIESPGPVGTSHNGDIEIVVDAEGAYTLKGPDGWSMSGREPGDPQEALDEAWALADRRHAKLTTKVSGPDGFKFNSEQTEAIAAVQAFLRGPDAFYGVFGYAGTGKTSVIQAACRNLGHRTVMSAPTHKAVGVLASMAHLGDPGAYDYRTIHSLLSLRPRKEKGVQVFLQDRKGQIPFQNYRLVIVDECSMLDDNLWGYVRREVENTETDLFGEPTKVVVMGDKLQLPPVSDTGRQSPSFSVPHSELTRVMRHGGVIGDAVGEVRDNIRSPEPRIADDASDDLGEIVNFEYRDDWLEDIVEHSDANIKALAYTNRAVDRINKFVRRRLHGNDVPPYLEGEIFVAAEAYANRERVLIQTEHEIRIDSVEESKHFGLDCWILKAVNVYTGEALTVHALDPRGRMRLTRKLDVLARSKKWSEFWPLKEAFAVLRPRYATTVHKSQGSTYDRVYLLQRDVLSSGRRDTVLRNRLLYVAYSRTAHSLLICNE